MGEPPLQMNLAGHATKTGSLKTGIAGGIGKNDICDHMKKFCDNSKRKRKRVDAENGGFGLPWCGRCLAAHPRLAIVTGRDHP